MTSTGARPAARWNDLTDHLALERGRVEATLAGDDDVGAADRVGKPDDGREEVEARDEATAERSDPTAEAACGSGTRKRADVDAVGREVPFTERPESFGEQVDRG